MGFFPSETYSLDKMVCVKLFETYRSVLHDTNSPEVWISEVERWRRQQAGKNTRNVLDTFDVCSTLVFQNIHKILYVMAHLPVTITTNERLLLFTLRRLKVYQQE